MLEAHYVHRFNNSDIAQLISYKHVVNVRK